MALRGSAPSALHPGDQHPSRVQTAAACFSTEHTGQVVRASPEAQASPGAFLPMWHFPAVGPPFPVTKGFPGLLPQDLTGLLSILACGASLQHHWGAPSAPLTQAQGQSR